MKIVFDACAVIALVKDEVGADIVEDYLLGNEYESIIHAVNLCEVYYGFLRSDGVGFTNEIIKKLEKSNVSFCEDLTKDFWQQVAKYKAEIKRISLADCFALTLANRENATLITSDRKEFEPIVSLNICQINFIR